MRFLYVMDPMCSWCYAFQPELEEFLAKHPSVKVDWIMGGLAPDNDQPMDENMKESISSYWHQIEKKTQVSFNHDFWKLNTPYRSTYPACRAVISAELLKTNSAQKMVKAIQSAYYREAKNPSLEETLLNCASSIGFDEKHFLEVLKSDEVKKRFQEHLKISQHLQVRGFPAFFYINDQNQVYPLTLGFCQSAKLDHAFKTINGV
ncbi:MAG: DsbA family protein [Lentisphaeraceae bacterium]|nr:DsbA family protein [Lentisphaeraceae bacterium]